MMVEHRQLHPIERGFWWDANFKRYQPVTPPVEAEKNLDTLEGYYIGRPEVKLAQETWGQTMEQQEEKSAQLKASAIEAGVEFPDDAA